MDEAPFCRCAWQVPGVLPDLKRPGLLITAENDWVLPDKEREKAKELLAKRTDHK